MKTTGKIFLTFLGGAAAGAVAGLLFAPEKGETTRELLAEKGEELKKTLEDALGTNIASSSDFNFY